MIRTLTFLSALLSALFLLNPGEAAAQEGGIPPGSYQLSCQNVSVKGVFLNATCNQPGDSKKFKLVNKFENFFMCADDIRNHNGSIECTKSEAPPLVKNALPAFDTAFRLHYGVTFDGDATSAASEVRTMFQRETPNIVSNYYKGLTPGVIGDYLEKYIKQPDRTALRGLLINRAFAAVYGGNHDASPQDIAYWNAESSKSGIFYQSIVAAETKKLNEPGNKIVRRAMILFAYKKMMGRTPTKDEIAYWEPKTERHEQIIDAGRLYLYSPNGAKDLAETVERALTEKSGSKPTPAQISNAVLKYGKTKPIFAEMKQ